MFPSTLLQKRMASHNRATVTGSASETAMTTDEGLVAAIRERIWDVEIGSMHILTLTANGH